jgi:hypothetical protein
MEKAMQPYQTEFPGFVLPNEIAALVASGELIDTSWHNDMCPSFSPNGISPDGSVRVWVDFEDRNDREYPDGKRYLVSLHNESGEGIDNPVETDSLKEVLDYLKDHWNVGLFVEVIGRKSAHS